MTKPHSLSVGVGEGGRVRLKCHAQCSQESVVRALTGSGLTSTDLFPKRPAGGVSGPASNGGPREVSAYDYTDAAGSLLYQTVRYDPKEFRPRRPDGRGGWAWSLQGVRRVLYRLPEPAEDLAAGRTVLLVEGEKAGGRNTPRR